MKRFKLGKLFVLGLVLTIGMVGCRKSPKGLTYLGPGTRSGPSNPRPGPPIDAQQNPVTPPDTGPISRPIVSGELPTTGRENFDNMNEDRAFFQADTVYFDFDSAVVKASERSKAETVATFLKSHADNKLTIEGHCDERGTEEYNRALGERRALALREYLVNLGISPERIRTLSWGEDKPAAQGHDESAWSKNRRGEFIRLTPKQ